jgi:hypothetical protein
VGHLLKVVFSVVLLASAGREAVTAAEPDAASSPRLRLVWIDVLGSAPFAFLNASREASAILAGAGVETEWTIGSTSAVCSGEDLKVVLMEGITKGARLPERVMGGTHRGAQSRTTWVYLSNVLWALGMQDRPRQSLTAREQAEIARALGRVVAHEIVHAVAPDLPHSRNGLMASRIGRAQLLYDSVILTAREQKALRAGLATFASHAEPVTDAIAMAAAPREGS